MHKFVNYIIATLFFACILGCGVQTYRLGCYREQCNTYREQLELASDRQSGIKANVERAGVVLSSTISTTQELRRQLKEVREIFEEMEDLLNGVNFNDNNNDNTMENK